MKSLLMFLHIDVLNSRWPDISCFSIVLLCSEPKPSSKDNELLAILDIIHVSPNYAVLGALQDRFKKNCFVTHLF